MADLPGGPTSKSKESRDKNGSKKIQQQNNLYPVLIALFVCTANEEFLSWEMTAVACAYATWYSWACVSLTQSAKLRLQIWSVNFGWPSIKFSPYTSKFWVATLEICSDSWTVASRYFVVCLPMAGCRGSAPFGTQSVQRLVRRAVVLSGSSFISCLPYFFTLASACECVRMH